MVEWGLEPGVIQFLVQPSSNDTVLDPWFLQTSTGGQVGRDQWATGSYCPEAREIWSWLASSQCFQEPAEISLPALCIQICLCPVPALWVRRGAYKSYRQTKTNLGSPC